MFRQILRAAAGVLVVYSLFFFALTDSGLLGPDEPRYAAIGREMAASGDWVTPRLWGEPWFEKPALLFWMTAAGFKAGLGNDLAPRLPVAFLGLAFLVFFHIWLRREFSEPAAWYSTAILATSGGWIAFVHVGVTDLPLTATFSTGMLLCLPWIRRGDRRVLAPAGIFFGLAVLAKGLVPGALAIPLVLAGWRRWKDLLLIGAAAFAVAAPWYVLCAMRNGRVFLEEFFWKHHFERFSSEALQHVQPFWFYGPVLLAVIAPWTPLVGKLFQRSLYADPRTRLLLWWFAFGFVFLSGSTNKLASYLLPLLPPLCALMGIALAEARRARWLLGAAALLTGLVPIAADVLPVAIRSGLSRAPAPAVPWAFVSIALAVAIAVWYAESKGSRSLAVQLLMVSMTAGIVYLKVTVMPVLDREVSTRGLWRQIEPVRDRVCTEPLHRTWSYGLNYYSVTPLPACEQTPLPLRVRQDPGEPAVLIR
ncbi:MAG: glycosyltransferase family 39 protein [bacterium]|nr:glycosyltransferase family 39 protein [bacterium]